MTRNLLRNMFSLQPGEGRRVALMAGYIFLLIATLLVIKPVRNSLFLNKFGAEMLPWAFVGVAVFSGGFVAIYSRIAAKVRLDRLIVYTLSANILACLAFWIPLQVKVQAGWVYFALYIWVALFGVLVTTQFWLLANYVFDVREAKRAFGLLGAGGIAGGIFGGYFTKLLAPVAGSEDLLLFGAVFLGGAIALMQIAWHTAARHRYREQIRREQRSIRSSSVRSTNPLKLLLGDRHLAMIASIVGVGVVVANLVDYQYSAIAAREIADEDQLTAFFGFWLSNLSVFSLILQVLLTSRIIRRLGVGGSLHFLPGGILLASVFLLSTGGLAAAVTVKLTEGGLKQSIHKAGLELLNLPVPAAVKNRVKAFIDVFVDNAATGLGGLLLILATQVLPLEVKAVSWLVLGLVLVWIGLNLLARREYIHAFRRAIEKRSLQGSDPSVSADDPALMDTVLRALDSGNEKQVLYALDLVEHVRHTKIAHRFASLLQDYPNRDVVCRVLRMAASYDEIDLSTLTRGFLAHKDPEIRVSAISYLVQRMDNPLETLRTCLSHPEVRQRIAGLRVAADLARNDRALREAIDFRAEFEGILLLFDEQHPDDIPEDERGEITELRVELADVLGRAAIPELYPYLHLLLADDDVDVLRTAVRAAGRSLSNEFVPTLLAHLGTKYVRTAAREALAAHGDSIIPTLIRALNDPRESYPVRLGIPRVLSMIGTQAAVRALQEQLEKQDTLLRHACLKALNRLRSEYADLRLDQRAVNRQLIDEVRTYYWTLGLLRRQEAGDAQRPGDREAAGGYHRARRLLVQALEERLDVNLEMIFRLLGLAYVPRDMHNAYLQLTGSGPDQRASAVEFLDNVLDQQVKRAVLPLVEAPDSDRILDQGRSLFDLDPPGGSRGLEAILEGDDSWLRVCVLYMIGESRRVDQVPLLQPYLDDDDPLVRETAQHAAATIDNQQAEPGR